MHRTIRGAVRWVAAAAIISNMAVFFSCASAPSEKKESAPSWTLETPAPDGTNTYFVGYADGPTGGVAAATDAATAGLIAEIMRYIGVTISAESTATAKATLDSFQADLVQTVKQTSTSRVAGFQVAEKYVAERTNGITVYILGRYATKDLEAEKKRIAAVFQEKVDAVAVPEAEGQDLLSSGDAIGAARKFIEASVAASGSDIENAAIKFERNINNAKEALSRIVVEKINDRLEAAPGETFAEPFKAVVKANGLPQAKVPVTIGYQSKLANGRLTTKTVTAVSGSDGVVSFEHPLPNFVGKAILTMRVDLGAATEPLYDTPSKYSSMVAGLEDEISAKRVTFEYSVVSKARSIPMTVLIVDTDPTGAASIGVTSSALLQTLSKNGFAVSAAPIGADSIIGSSDSNILSSAKAALGNKAQRFAYGTTRVVSIKDDRGQKIATVAAEIKVVDLASGRMLYSSSKQVPAVASSDKEAVDAARRLLGEKTIGEDLAASLP